MSDGLGEGGGVRGLEVMWGKVEWSEGLGYGRVRR